MLDRYEVYSPNRKKKRSQFIARIVKIVIAVFFFYVIVTHFVIATFAVDSASMKPGIETGERLFASPIPYGIFVPFASSRFAGFQKPDRGDVVVLTPPYITKQNPLEKLIEPFINFFTFEQGSLNAAASGKRLHSGKIKRIIAIPGDTVKVENFIAFIKSEQSQAFMKENEMTKKAYKPFVDENIFPKDWQVSFPFSGNTAELKLKANEYFVLGDNRADSNDSRSWGPIEFSRITSKVILRYWPLTKIASY